LAAIFFVLVILIIGSGIVYGKVYEQKIFPGVRINSTKLGGKTKEEAQDLIQKIGDQLINKGLNFYYKSKKININPVIISPTDPDLAYEIFSFDIDRMINEAFLIGRQKTDNNPLISFIKNLNEQFKILIFGKEIPLNYKLNENKLKEILKENFANFEIPPQDARLAIVIENDTSTHKPYQINIIKEEPGRIFDYERAIKNLKNNINFGEIKPIELVLIPSKPKIFEKEAQKYLDQVGIILDLAPLTLTYEDKKWVLEQNQIAPLLELQFQDEKIILGLNKEKTIELLKSFAQEINLPPQDAKFEIVDNRVTKFQASQDGLELNLEESYRKINNLLINQKNNKIELVVKISQPNITVAEANNLGIKEIIGVGKSNFKGSPKNRRHNIRVGVNKLNGILIKPEEEFSLLGALGEVNEKTGYLPELVIKGDRTIPEFGGGLCQIGTTTFRAALDAGLLITQRQNHSYRVRYYEPAGMDATIYDPWPDFRFVNDTGNWILFVAKMEEDELIFEFWGTRDGRKVEITKPRIFNITKPPPLKEIKTTDLPPGEKKCTESAHNGADTEFTQTITYPNGEVKTKVWKSHYKPWQAICLMGVKPEELETITETPIEISPESVQSDINANVNLNTKANPN